MKLYRIIPDQFCNPEMVYPYPEEALYQLGYIGYTEHSPFFGVIDPLDRDYNPLYDKGGPGKFFYTNPWDAVFCSFDLRGTHYLVRVHEYDFPNEVIDKSQQGLGAYYGCYRMNEVKIPTSLLGEMEGFIETVSDELNDQISEKNKQIYEESVEVYKKYGADDISDIIKTKVLGNQDIYDNLHKTCIEHFIFAVKSPYITGKIFQVNRTFDRDNGGWQGIDYIDLINRSSKVLTYKNIPDYMIKWFEDKVHENESCAKVLKKIKK